MSFFRATNKQTGQVVEYEDAAPLPIHLNEDWHLEEVGVAFVAPDAPVDTRMFAGRRQLTKLEFVQLLGNDFVSILAASKQSIEIEAFVMLVTLATPDPDGYSINLDDPRMQALHQLEAAGVLGAGRASEILNG